MVVCYAVRGSLLAFGFGEGHGGWISSFPRCVDFSVIVRTEPSGGSGKYWFDADGWVI